MFSANIYLTVTLKSLQKLRTKQNLFRTLVGYLIASVITAEIYIPVYFKSNLSSVYQVRKL